MTDFKLKIAAENRSWVHVLENNINIFDDPEPQLIAMVKVKMLCENLKTTMWHFDDGWRHVW